MFSVKRQGTSSIDRFLDSFLINTIHFMILLKLPCEVFELFNSVNSKFRPFMIGSNWISVSNLLLEIGNSSFIT